MIRYGVIYGLARYLVNSSVQDMILRRRRFHSQIIPGPCGTKQHCLFNSSHDGPVAGRRLLGVGHSPNGTRRMQLLQLTTCSLLGITTLYYMFSAISCSLRHFDHVFTFHAVEGCEILPPPKGWLKPQDCFHPQCHLRLKRLRNMTPVVISWILRLVRKGRMPRWTTGEEQRNDL